MIISFFGLIFLFFTFSPRVYHFFSFSIFYTTPSKSVKILYLSFLVNKDLEEHYKKW